MPHLKPHDNFAGLLSSDRLKAFASFENTSEENENWDDNFEGDLITIKGPHKAAEADSHELETIRPYKVRPAVVTNIHPVVGAKNNGRKVSNAILSRPKSPIKAQVESKCVLPSRPAAMYREQLVDDYSDLFVDNDSIFDRRLNIVKVTSPRLWDGNKLLTTQFQGRCSFTQIVPSVGPDELAPFGAIAGN